MLSAASRRRDRTRQVLIGSEPAGAQKLSTQAVCGPVTSVHVQREDDVAYNESGLARDQTADGTGRCSCGVRRRPCGEPLHACRMVRHKMSVLLVCLRAAYYAPASCQLSRKRELEINIFYCEYQAIYPARPKGSNLSATTRNGRSQSQRFAVYTYAILLHICAVLFCCSLNLARAGAGVVLIGLGCRGPLAHYAANVVSAY